MTEAMKLDDSRARLEQIANLEGRNFSLQVQVSRLEKKNIEKKELIASANDEINALRLKIIKLESKHRMESICAEDAIIELMREDAIIELGRPDADKSSVNKDEKLVDSLNRQLGHLITQSLDVKGVPFTLAFGLTDPRQGDADRADRVVALNIRITAARMKGSKEVRVLTEVTVPHPASNMDILLDGYPVKDMIDDKETKDNDEGEKK